MKVLILRVFLVVTILLVVGYFVPNAHAQVSTPSHLKYFGYYLTDLGTISVTYDSEIRDFGNSNVVRAHYIYLNQLKEKNLLAIVGVPRAGSSFDSFLSEWNSWLPIMQNSRDSIYAFYFDEPFWNSIINRPGQSLNPDFPGKFKQITQKIHQDFPDKAIMIVEAYTMFENPERINYVKSGIDYVTDIGIDCYYTTGNCIGTNWNAHMTVYNKMKSIAGTRKIWLIPDGYTNNPSTIGLLKPAFDNYFNLANSDPQVVGMLNFVYGHRSSGLSITLSDIIQPAGQYYDQALRSRQIATGRAIIANAPTPPSHMAGDLTDVGDTSTNQVNVDDYNFFKTYFNAPPPRWQTYKLTIFDFNNIVTNFGK